MSRGTNLYGKIVSGFGLFSGVMTLITWICLLPALHPKISVDDNDFISDVNRSSWRLIIFTFAPDTFVDIWTPFVFGLISILCHFRIFDLSWMCRTFAHFFLWNFIQALFANIGYSGGVGVIASAFSLLTTLLSAVAFFICGDQSASLEINVKR